ncbi:MAG: helicase-related protein [bacterium]|nr:helicase-related protein [bacterium]
MNYPKIIDNDRKFLKDTLIKVAKDYSEISIATGYWDLEGMKLILPEIKHYSKIRLLIGREPVISRYQLQIPEPESNYPDQDIKYDLSMLKPDSALTETVASIKTLIEKGTLEVRVYRKKFLHAKCYVFGSYTSDTAVGIIGSSNFTKNGLTQNIELNALESDHRIVLSKPETESQEVGHLFWFDSLWNEETTEKWNEEFGEILSMSTVGHITYSPYEMYMATLWNLYESEVTEEIKLSNDISKNLYAFQQRNAQLLINKIERTGLAMLADSVGLGKTITAGAVIKHYLEQGARRIYVIVPARLISQWKDDLADKHDIHGGYELISMQDMRAVEDAMSRDKYRNVDLFIIDEAHNLRNDNSTRHIKILEWFSNNPESKVLLVTATPVNNQLTDFVNQIQLASKGKLDSFPIVYSTSKKREVIDFFEAVKRLVSYIKIKENADEAPDWDRVNKVMRQGLKHFLVRSTRKGIMKDFNGGLLGNDGVMRTFPTSVVRPTEYNFSAENDTILSDQISKLVGTHFENIDPRSIDIDKLISITQRTEHPFDTMKTNFVSSKSIQSGVFTNLFQIILTFGFAPYKARVYDNRFYGKTPEEIKEYNLKPKENFAVLSQLGIHNLIRVSLLKRLESSPFALKNSIKNYTNRLSVFSDWLEKGYILSFKDIAELVKEYGDDLEEVPGDAMDEKILADPSLYNIKALKKDVERDQKIAKILIELCESIQRNDDKLMRFVKLIKEIKQTTGTKKILIFSFYADTIRYLQENLGAHLSESEMSASAFVTGADASDIKQITGRFSPISKGFVINEMYPEINYLFATDVLSEGQNLQDCSVLVNFDLHWNPVRMIQRNGRINRLGSQFEEVYVYNMAPEKQLETYLKLVKRLEQKINKIAHTIGTDQPILGEVENPIEYIDQADDAEEIDQVTDLYNETTASHALLELEDDAGFLTEDEYIFELRSFLKNGTEKEINTIKNISVGKWSYLPETKRALADTPDVIGLTQTMIREDENKALYPIDIFVEYQAIDGKVGVLDTIDALTQIKTTPDNSKRAVDAIKTNKERSFIKKLMERQAEEEATSETLVFRRTPTVEIILDSVAKYLPDLQLSGALDRIDSKLELKKTRKLFSDAKEDLKTYEQLRPITLERFTTLVIELTKEKKPEKTVDRINTLLFYAK